MCKRGDIYYVDFGEDYNSSKQCGIRPAVVVSNNKANTFSPIITVVPLTSKIHKKRSLPTHVMVPPSVCSGLERSSMALAEQVETIDKSQLREHKGSIINTKIMGEITRALQIQIGADEAYN